MNSPSPFHRGFQQTKRGKIETQLRGSQLAEVLFSLLSHALVDYVLILRVARVCLTIKKNKNELHSLSREILNTNYYRLCFLAYVQYDVFLIISSSV